MSGEIDFAECRRLDLDLAMVAAGLQGAAAAVGVVVVILEKAVVDDEDLPGERRAGQ